jgi:predicted DNA-binding transcriptional regulator AlpA
MPEKPRTMNPISNPALTEKEVAEWLCCSLANVRKWRRLKEGPPFVKIGKIVRYFKSDVEKFIEQLPRSS